MGWDQSYTPLTRPRLKCIVRMAQGTNSLKLLLLPECLPGTRAQNGSVASAGAGAGAGAGVLLRAGACPGAVVGLVARLVRLLVASALAVHTAARLGASSEHPLSGL